MSDKPKETGVLPTSELKHVPFARRLRQAPTGGGFAMDGYWVWCGSPIQGEDGRYHLFSARWPQDLKFLPAYQSYSEIVHASAHKPTGPYRFENVVLPDRGPAFWDGRMTHNPTVLSALTRTSPLAKGSGETIRQYPSSPCVSDVTTRSVVVLRRKSGTKMNRWKTLLIK